ncbi:hypothetical protein GCM10007923_58850 [Shinella yambaruensis]|uniref:Uncharacterized protein n=1 Tax=Shinella yambaruensis TaxID=415996 RepID=A0ABQ5ZRE0_9HYPH|nr:hypothetical protein GCM10007923_58850 [Shinella yambaruensis]
MQEAFKGRECTFGENLGTGALLRRRGAFHGYGLSAWRPDQRKKPAFPHHARDTHAPSNKPEVIFQPSV